MRRIVATVACVGLLLAVFGYRAWRRADASEATVFQAMIDLAREPDRGDIAIELDRLRADEVFWSSS